MYNKSIRKKERKKMTIEVFNDQKLTIGFVKSQNKIEGMNTVRQYFPNAGSVSSQSSLPVNDSRCKMIAPNVYSWENV
jgi:hypothetical protein